MWTRKRARAHKHTHTHIHTHTKMFECFSFTKHKSNTLYIDNNFIEILTFT